MKHRIEKFGSISNSLFGFYKSSRLYIYTNIRFDCLEYYYVRPEVEDLNLLHRESKVDIFIKLKDQTIIV